MLTETLAFSIFLWNTAVGGTFLLLSSNLQSKIDWYPKTRFGIISTRSCKRYTTVIIPTLTNDLEVVQSLIPLQVNGTRFLAEHRFCIETSNLTMVHLPFLTIVRLFTSLPVFLDETHTVKLGDFGLSKALAQASFANTYVGVSAFKSIPSTDSDAICGDPLLHVPGTYARKGLRFEIRHLVVGLPHLWVMRIETTIPWSKNTFGTKYIYSVSFTVNIVFQTLISQVVMAAYPHFRGGIPRPLLQLSNPCLI